MARRSSRKETYSQKVIGLATMGLPTPVQSVAKSRWGSRLLLILVPVLIGMGVVTVSWTGLLPSISLNGARATQVGEEFKRGAIKAAERIRQSGDANYR
ncbi:MAG: hypothetical protein WCQ77_05270 [Planctomycetota bacterium]